MTTTKTARFVRNLEDFTGDARLYELSEPHAGYGEGPVSRVVVSAVSVLGVPETYIFPADESGGVASWGEMPGSFKGALDHERALREAGYEVAS